ncbi:MAG: class I SAM-dependent methyltransferase [Pseudomonadota bacterium]
MSVFYQVNNFPVHSVLNMPTRAKALNYPTGDILLGFCCNCGFISNVAFDAGLLEYSSDCEESQGFSSTFNKFSHNLATYLIEKYDLHHKDILEIGCGKGEFLTLLCELGQNRGVGFDPAYVRGRHTSKAADRITFIQDFYSEKYAGYQADFICCKMTLEHIHRTEQFVSTVRQAIEDRLNTIVFFQIPDVTRILRDCAFEDIYYEHCSYFSPGSLARLFRKCRFDVIHLATEYDDQYLIIEAKPADPPSLPPLPREDDIEKLKHYVEGFQTKYQSKLFSWQKRLQKISAKDQRLVLWGSGSKAVSFLTTFQVYDAIEYVVDINPYRHGSYMAGTGQEIVAPEFLQEYNPDMVIIMNPIYYDEIKQDLNRMGLNPHLLTL